MRTFYKNKSGSIFAVRKNANGAYCAYHRICRGGKLSTHWLPVRSLTPRWKESQAQEDLDRYADKFGIRFYAQVD